MVAGSEGEADEVMAVVAAMRRRDRALEASLPRKAADAATAAADEPASDSDDEASIAAMTLMSRPISALAVADCNNEPQAAVASTACRRMPIQLGP